MRPILLPGEHNQQWTGSPSSWLNGAGAKRGLGSREIKRAQTAKPHDPTPNTPCAPAVLIRAAGSELFLNPTFPNCRVRPISRGQFRRASTATGHWSPDRQEVSHGSSTARASFVSDYFPPLAASSAAASCARRKLDTLAEYSLRAHRVSAKSGRCTAPGHAAGG